MKRLLYCAELNTIIIAHEESIDSETGTICFPVEWDHRDMYDAQIYYLNRVKNIKDLRDLADLFSWEFIGEFD